MNADTEMKVVSLQEKIITLLDEEDILRELKKAAAADFRDRINEIKAKRVKHQQELKAVNKAAIETEGSVFLEETEKQITSKSKKVSV